MALSPSLLPGARLHRSVPPHSWCITLDELKGFVAEVRREWRQGGIPNSESLPNGRHDDPRHGPNMYQVNEYYVKPLTRLAGGMSYALMLRPQGLPCEVFISHAWAEGIFEFLDAVLRAWPCGKRNLYCCLLANPQNLDIGQLLDVAPSASPFASALTVATHVVVVPNSTVAVYTRLWCVYEAYLATRMEKVFLMPARSESEKRCRAIGRWLLSPMLLGIFVGTAMGLSIKVCGAMSGYALAVVTIGNAVGLLATALWPITYMKPLWLQLVDAFWLLGYCTVATAFLVAWLEASGRGVDDFAEAENTARGILSLVFRWLHVLCVVVLNMGVVGQNVTCMLEEESLQLQAERLHFNSVRHAECSNGQDQERIWRELSGSEESVDNAISILVKAGSYTKSLSRQFKDGVDITKAGYADIYIRVFQAAQIWLATAVCCADRAHYLGGKVLPWWLVWLPVLVSLAVAVASPFVLMRFYRKAPDVAVFSGKALCVAGVLAFCSCLFVIQWGNPLLSKHLFAGTPEQMAVLWDTTHPVADAVALLWPILAAGLAASFIFLGPAVICGRIALLLRSVRRYCAEGKLGNADDSKKVAQNEGSEDEEDPQPSDFSPVVPAALAKKADT